MIKYKLVCKKCNFLFDSWFSSSKDFEKLKKKNFINCHKCNSKNVEKTLMAPKLVKNSLKETYYKNNSKLKEINKKIKEYQKFIKNNFEYVGENFAYEARSIHYDSKNKSKGIYGSASREDLKELKEEGIDAQMFPWVDENKN